MKILFFCCQIWKFLTADLPPQSKKGLSMSTFFSWWLSSMQEWTGRPRGARPAPGSGLSIAHLACPPPPWATDHLRMLSVSRLGIWILGCQLRIWLCLSSSERWQRSDGVNIGIAVNWCFENRGRQTLLSPDVFLSEVATVVRCRKMKETTFTLSFLS